MRRWLHPFHFFVTSLLAVGVMVDVAGAPPLPTSTMNSHRSMLLAIDDVHMHVEETGVGPPVVLLHGFGASTFSWRFLVSELASSHRVVAIDLKGFGKSDKPLDGKYSPRDQSILIRRVLEKLELTGVTLVGHSYGGTVALLLAIDDVKASSRLIERLVLIGPASHAQAIPGFIAGLRIPFFGSLATHALPKSLLVMHVLREVFYDRTKISDEVVCAYASPLHTTGAISALVAVASEIIPPDIEDIVTRYATISLPTLLLWGEKDKIVPFSSIESLSTQLPNVERRVIPDCGHAPHEECPASAVPLVSNFIKSAK